MKKVIIVLCLLTIAWFFNSTIYKKERLNVPLEPEEVAATVSIEAEMQKQEVDNEKDLKLEKMQVSYAELKEARKKTSMHLSRLSSRLRRSEFPPEQAKTISQDMRSANYRLKNPKLLGAFSDVDEIDSELQQLSEITAKLDKIKNLLDEKRKNNP